MITSIRLKNFKNFADETLRVGPFTILVGANASGKSNIRDAFRFLHGIGRGYTLAEIFGGKYGGGGQREWEPIRGAMNEITRFGQEAFSIEVGLKLSNGNASYLIEVSAGEKRPGEFRVVKEELKLESEPIYTAHGDGANLRVCRMRNPTEERPFDLGQPALTQLIRFFGSKQSSPVPVSVEVEGVKATQLVRFFSLAQALMEEICSVLSNIRFLELSPERMREPAFPGATVLGDSGENLPTALQEICSDPKRQEILTSWIAELTPMDVTGFEFPRDPSGRVHLVIREKNGREVSAYSASDGTLRFLGVLAALLGKNPAGLYFFEEIENGIHPVRLGLLLDLFEGAIRGDGQVIGTTHAPTLLTAMNDDTFENSSVVCRLEENADAIIRPLSKLHNVRELRKDQGLGRLHESGWMETALFFTEDYDEAEDKP